LPVVKPAGEILVDMKLIKRWLKNRGIEKDAITYKNAAILIGVHYRTLHYWRRTDESFKSVLIDENRYSRISKTKFLEWVAINKVK